MTCLYLDPFSGISGNMLLGMLFDLGLDYCQFQNELKKLNLAGYHLTLESIRRSAIGGKLFDVKLEDANHHVDESLTAKEVQKNDSPAGINDNEKINHHHHGRNLAEIKRIISQADLKSAIKTQAIGVFDEIARAEASVHRLSLDKVHFHEVGALDSIIDILGFFIGLDLLGITKVISGPLVDGSGLIKVAHGTMPVPVPAVMQMRKNSGIPVHQREDVRTELVTPTGFAIVKQVVSSFGPIPEEMQIEKIGYGFGTRQTGHLNALRGLLLTASPSHKEGRTTGDEIVEIHANLDDQPGEGLGFVIGKLLEAGAYDAYFTPIYMKKGRPAYQMTVITPKQKCQIMADLLFQHTTTFGIRYVNLKRTILPRTFKKVCTKFGEVTLKIGMIKSSKKVTVEYDSAAILANQHHVSLEQVQQAALLAYNKEDGMA